MVLDKQVLVLVLVLDKQVLNPSLFNTAECNNTQTSSSPAVSIVAMKDLLLQRSVFAGPVL